MADETDPTVPVVCPECETETAVPIDDVADAVERHNEGVHDGEDVAQVDPELAERVQDLVAEDLGLLGDPADD
ncbi:hypothetical protein [Halosimplex marinum]|uniref:hypothetical protein n=1 Tax=Halosimplex marinum TaxID=3396620 RepID=UPI003F552DC3